MGAAVTIMGGGDIVPAMDRGLLDAAEFNNPSSAKVLGFPDVSKVYMLQSYHQSAECFEIIFNKTKYDALPADLQAVLKYASEAASADKIGRAHVWTPVTNAPLVCRLMLEKQNTKLITHSNHAYN